MEDNAFGKLVRSYRKQRGWTQIELAERWGFTRVYVSQIEQGKRKLDKQEQVTRLADILGISEERLAAVGKIPALKERSMQGNLLEGNEALLQALLEPAQNTVKLSWLVWRGDGGIIDVESSLFDLVQRLEQILSAYKGQFVKPSFQILALAHEMLGKMAMDKMRTRDALLHFQEMYDIAEEIADPNLTVLALTHQAEVLRKANRYEASFRRLEGVERYIKQHVEEVEAHIQGLYWELYAINYFNYKNEQGFLRAINRSEEIASHIQATIDTVSSGFDLVEVLQTKALGFTLLWQPEKAVDIYQTTDTLRPFRPLRERSSYNIIKAQMYYYLGDFKNGARYARNGMTIAENIGSQRYVTRLSLMADRLSGTPLGRERALKEIRGEVLESLQRMND